MFGLGSLGRWYRDVAGERVKLRVMVMFAIDPL